MPFTNPPAAPPAAPDAPVRGTATFSARVDAFLGFVSQMRTWLAGFVGWAKTNLDELWVVYQDVTTKAGQVHDDAQAAAASALAATNTVGDFPKRYLGAKAANPAKDNSGLDLVVGALYWNTTAGEMRAWNGAAWAVSYLPVGDYLTKAGGTLTGPLNEARGASIPSAATLDLNAATGNFLHITGTNAVTAVTLAPGAERTVIFDGALTLTHSATLQLEGLANIVTAPGDRATFRGDAGGVVYCLYRRADGKALVMPAVGPRALGASFPATVNPSSFGSGNFKMCRLDDSRALVMLGNSNNGLRATLLTKQQDNTLQRTDVMLDAGIPNYFISILTLTALDANRALLVYRSPDGGGPYKFAVITVAGTTISIGPILDNTYNITPTYSAALLMSANRVVFASGTAGGTMYVRTIDTSGATPAFVGNLFSQSTNSGNGWYALNLIRTADDAFELIGSHGASEHWRMGITAGSVISRLSLGYLSGSPVGAEFPAIGVGNGEVLAVYQNGSPSATYVEQRRMAGTAATPVQTFPFSQFPQMSTGKIALSGSCVILAVGTGLIVFARAGDQFLYTSFKGIFNGNTSQISFEVLSAELLLVVYFDPFNSSYFTARLVEIGTAK